jgi:DNA-binding NarL/FixJ family response regulator
LLPDGVSNAHLVECVSVVGAGGKWSDPSILQQLLTPGLLHGSAHKLTGREAEVAGLVSRGLRNKTIARQLRVSEGTVKMHLHHVFEKLHLASRAELAWAALGHGADWPNAGAHGLR